MMEGIHNLAGMHWKRQISFFIALLMLGHLQYLINYQIKLLELKVCILLLGPLFVVWNY